MTILRAATHETERGDHDSAGHIILTPTQTVGSRRPLRGSNSGPPHQESGALPQDQIMNAPCQVSHGSPVILLLAFLFSLSLPLHFCTPSFSCLVNIFIVIAFFFLHYLLNPLFLSMYMYLCFCLSLSLSPRPLYTIFFNTALHLSPHLIRLNSLLFLSRFLYYSLTELILSSRATSTHRQSQVKSAR